MIALTTAIVFILLALAGCGNGGTSQQGAVVGGGTGKALVLELSQPG